MCVEDMTVVSSVPSIEPMHDANGITTSRITIADSRAGTAILRSCPLFTAVHLCLFWGSFLVTMTAITDGREVARDKFRCMDCRGKYTLHTPIIVSIMILRPGPDQDRYRAISPGAF